MLEFLNAVQVSLVNPDKHGKKNVYDFVADTFSSIVIDLPDEEARRTFSIERSAIVTIKTSDRKTHNIGTHNIPARVQISSNLTSANLIIKCKMLTDPFL